MDEPSERSSSNALGGRPEFEATDERRRVVRAMAAYGVPQAAIAKSIGCSPPTLRKHFADEIETASHEANAKVAEALFRKATGDGQAAVTAAIFWLKARANWRDTPPPQVAMGQCRPETMTDEELAAFTSGTGEPGEEGGAGGTGEPAAGA